MNLSLALSVTSGSIDAFQDSPEQPQPRALPPVASAPGRILIDGSKTPHLIPDYVAVASLFHALALPEEADAGANQRFLIQTDALRLNRPDIEALRAEMTRFYYARERHRAEVEPLAKFASRDNFDERRRVEQQFDRMVIATYEKLLRSLSPDGATKLRTQVDIQKSRSKKFGPPEISR